jgi:hypothetical protein
METLPLIIGGHRMVFMHKPPLGVDLLKADG